MLRFVGAIGVLRIGAFSLNATATTSFARSGGEQCFCWARDHLREPLGLDAAGDIFSAGLVVGIMWGL